MKCRSCYIVDSKFMMDTLTSEGSGKRPVSSLEKTNLPSMETSKEPVVEITLC